MGMPWLMSALCLVFLYCFSGFGLALLLGGPRYATVEVEIYTLVAHELQLTQAGVLAGWMLLTTGLCALAYSALERRLAAPSAGAAAGPHPPLPNAPGGTAVSRLGLLARIASPKMAPTLALSARAAPAVPSLAPSAALAAA